MNPDVYREIKRRILFLEYAPGQILNENVLAKEFGVSRTPMREVLYRLSWEQLARIIARTGTMVTQIEFQTMMHTYQTRLGIEGEVGRLCAELATDDHLEAIRGIREDCELLTGHKAPDSLVEIDRRLRQIVHDATGNPILQSVSDHLYTLAGQARDGMETARVRRDALVRHFDRIRAKYLGVPGEVKL